MAKVRRSLPKVGLRHGRPSHSHRANSLRYSFGHSKVRIVFKVNPVVSVHMQPLGPAPLHTKGFWHLSVACASLSFPLWVPEILPSPSLILCLRIVPLSPENEEGLVLCTDDPEETRRPDLLSVREQIPTRVKKHLNEPWDTPETILE